LNKSDTKQQPDYVAVTSGHFSAFALSVTNKRPVASGVTDGRARGRVAPLSS